MANFIKFDNDDNGTILIEIDAKKGHQAVGRGEQIINALDKQFKELIIPSVIGQCNAFTEAYEKLKSTNLPPSKAELEFNLKLNAEGNIYVAKSGAEANYKIKFEWDLT